MRLSLRVLSSGRWQGREVPIERFPFYIGRGPECQLRPAHAQVSHRHCVFLLRDAGLFVKDLGSTNGTFIDGIQTRGEHELRSGQCLQIGPLLFRVGVQRMIAENESERPETEVLDDAEDAAASVFLDDTQLGVAPPGDPPAEEKNGEDGKSTIADLSLSETWRQDQSPEPPKNGDTSRKTGGSEADTSQAARAILRSYRRPKK